MNNRTILAMETGPACRRAKCFALLVGVLLAVATSSAQTPSPAARSSQSPSPAAQSSQSPSPAAQFEGSFDKLEVETLGGWAWDGTRPNVAIKVEIYDGPKLLGTVTAETFRADLKTAGKGNGRHAFDYVLPSTLRDGQLHTISIRYAGTSSELPGSPKTLLFPKS